MRVTHPVHVGVASLGDVELEAVMEHSKIPHEMLKEVRERKAHHTHSTI